MCLNWAEKKTSLVQENGSLKGEIVSVAAVPD